MKTFLLSTILLFLYLPVNSQSFKRGPYTNTSISLPIVSDFTGDGKPDVVGASRFFSPTGDLKLHINSSEPDSIIFKTKDLGIKVYGNPGAGDFDSDGDMDLVVTESVNKKILILSNNGAGSFVSNQINSEIAFQFLTSDMDGDGDIDIVSLDIDKLSAYLIINKGNGVFQTSNLLTNVKDLYTYELEDIDNDDDTDIIVGFDDYFDGKIVLLENQGNATFKEHIITEKATGSLENLQIIDINKDGFKDIVYSSTYSSTLKVLLQQSDKKYTERNLTQGSGTIRSFNVADYNTDGIMDILIGCNSANNTYHQGISTASLEYSSEVVTGIQPMYYIVNGDFDSDKDLDAILSNSDFWWITNELEQSFVKVNQVNKDHFLVYPNPFRTHLNLDVSNDIDFFITDFQGHRLFHSNEKLPPFNLEFLNEGSYFLTVIDKKSGKIVETLKIIKMR